MPELGSVFSKIPKMLTLNPARSKIVNQAFERHANSTLASCYCMFNLWSLGMVLFEAGGRSVAGMPKQNDRQKNLQSQYCRAVANVCVSLTATCLGSDVCKVSGPVMGINLNGANEWRELEEIQVKDFLQRSK